MRYVLLLLSFCLLAAPAWGEGDFSLFGAKLGMTREELSQKWTPLESGEYYIKDSVLFGVRPEFDHQDRLYRLTFSVPLGDKYPFALSSTALQSLVSRKWGGRPNISVGVRVGREAVEITVLHKGFADEYARVIEADLSALLQP